MESGVQGAGEVFQSTVDLYGHHPLSRSQPPGDGERGHQVGPGGRAGEDAFGPGGRAGHLEGLPLRYGDDLVDVLRAQLRWATTDATALDVVGSGRTAGEH